jgi:hypothetical protein
MNAAVRVEEVAGKLERTHPAAPRHRVGRGLPRDVFSRHSNGHGRRAAPATCTTRPQNSSRVIDSSNARSSLRTTVRRPPGVSQMAMAWEGAPAAKTAV